MSEKQQAEYVVEALGLHAAKLWTHIKPYHVVALCNALAAEKERTRKAEARAAIVDQTSLTDLSESNRVLRAEIASLTEKLKAAEKSWDDCDKQRIYNELRTTQAEAKCAAMAEFLVELREAAINLADQTGWSDGLKKAVAKTRLKVEASKARLMVVEELKIYGARLKSLAIDIHDQRLHKAVEILGVRLWGFLSDLAEAEEKDGHG